MKFLLAPIVLLIHLLPFAAQPLSAQLKARLDSIATQDVPSGAPGIATAVIRNGRVIYEKCAGYADLSDSSRITPTTRFNIASNGKQFTALAILTLVNERKLRLTDDIRRYFPLLFPAIRERITVQSLLNHTSGIRDCYDLWSLQGYTWWENSFSNRDVLALMEKQQDLNFAPGTRYLYSNTNYILLALLIEKVSGKSFVAFTNELFRKLHMPNTSFEDDYTRIRGPIARAYFNFGSWTTYQWIWNVCGDGNIFSTLEDQVQWEKIIQGRGRTLVSRQLIAQSQQRPEGSTFRNYGYGLEFGKYKGMEYAFHEGATGAWKATVTRFPVRNTSIITLTNTGKSIPAMQTRQMADILFHLPPDASYLVTQPARTGKWVSEEEITGTYLTESDFFFRFEKRENKIFLVRSGRNDVELERESANIFRQKYDTLFKQEFTYNTNGDLQVTAYYINHAPYSLTRQAADFSRFDYKKLNGIYTNAETGTSLDIRHTNGQQYDIRFPGNEDVSKGLLITPQKLLVNNYALSIEEINDRITNLRLSGDRMKAVRFLKQP